MVQQLSLFASIHKSQYNLTIASLATLTGFQPSQFQSYNLICSPKTIVKYEPNSKNAQYEQYKIIMKSPFNEDEDDPKGSKEWIMQVNDIPSAGKRKINIQSLLESNIQLNSNQTIEESLGDLGYKIESDYVLKGERFFHQNNITIEIFQILLKKEDGEWSVLNDDGFVIKTFINVEKSTDIENLQKSSQILLNLKNELQGLIELDIPDRNSMDSRIGLRK